VSYQVKLRSPAQKELDSVIGRDYEAIAKAISVLAENPRPAAVKKLADSGLWRLRLRKYRIVYAIDDRAREVIVVRIALRNEDTYKRL
jgi:mRNA interferase RelE/StbE